MAEDVKGDGVVAQGVLKVEAEVLNRDDPAGVVERLVGANQQKVEAPPAQKLYPQNVIEGIGNGCLLDLRVRMAINMLTSSPMFAGGVSDVIGGTMAARIALDCATELLRLAEERGLVQPLPDDDNLNRQARLQARRTARYSVASQMAANHMATEEGGRITTPAGVAGRFNQ